MVELAASTDLGRVTLVKGFGGRFMSKTVLLLLALGCVLYLLYINGYLVTNRKKAVMYIETRRGTHATFSACTGYTKRMVRFKESRLYHFTLSSELTKGKLSVELLHSEKHQIMCLNENQRNADLAIDKNKRYYLVVRFHSATGNYALHWN